MAAGTDIDGNAGFLIFTFIPIPFILFWYKNKKRDVNKTDSQEVPKRNKKNKSRLQSVYSSITPPTISFKKKIKINIPVENINTDKKNSSFPSNLESYLHKSVSELLELSESEFLEFKSTLKWDIRLERANPLLIGEIIKTIAGFLNNKGGVLIIGYDDDNNVLYGLEKDYPVTSKKSNYDGWQQYFINQVNERLGKEINHYFTIESVPHDGKTIARINVSKSPKPVFAKQNQQGGDFFVRIHGQTENLNPEDTNKWIKEHFSN
ncbi:MAG: ATP-binding protein [Candidatus Nitrosopelagicus sp.]|nr:ATP-binding protein [Candidatus Nitrosopelagicus sp.]